MIDRLYSCCLCGGDCTGYEVEMSTGKHIVCLTCATANANWSRSLRGME